MEALNEESAMKNLCERFQRMGSTAGKVITCKAAVAWGPKQPLVIEEIQVDPPNSMEVRIKITHTSLCHSDLTFWMIEDEKLFPRIFGHEAAGIVESVGAGITDLKEGDHVIPLFSGECGDCVYCKSEKTNLCGNFRVDAFRTVMRSDNKSRFSLSGKPVYHFFSSTFSEYTVVDYACVVKINPKAPLEKVCLLSCGIATGVGAAWNTANVEYGSTVAIFGLGAVGLAVAEGARVRGASRIIGVDTNPNKFPKAMALGVTECINSKDQSKPINEVIRDISDGGVDYSFECVGHADIMYQAFLSAHDGWGLAVLVGIDASPRKISLSPLEFFDGRKIDGSTFGGFKGKTQLPDLVERCMNKEISVEEFITHELPFSDINKAFDLLVEGNCLRCVLHL
jgi:alcohol dehydrogenase